MNGEINLKGWNQIIFNLIVNKFQNTKFTTSDIYRYIPEFKKVYPNNNYIEEKIRQTLQKLRDKKIVKFIDKGICQLIPEYKKETVEAKEKKNTRDFVYLMSNESIPGWIKIGRTNSITKRVRQLNTGAPLPFIVEKTIETHSAYDSLTLEKTIHAMIDTINPNVRKNTAASKREFFMLTIDQAIKIFDLVVKINQTEINKNI
ncbi:Dam-replacing protein (DRP), restriction endonuclease [Alteracholeplasma palmae J233]|uniref:Dam-replacing protein (DRP), restriction endonuclease n=1 Tax=Alteracholeplasma palmae (strain ATCC 49389 / J233) TaxID=1318466 RepID=U4KQU5_ALTPJ|nr:GIY-YIG nuclease family protein [Alteracholeplasma palmae]CCV63611.1 Dam-replacing protein (DRP), restriction endonuclease [Alteracholeplasma palmae J233]